MIYVFQIDCAENNDSFFSRAPGVPVVFYRGAGFQVGEAPWIPDGIRVDVEDRNETGALTRCVLTLIELEERRPEGLKSSRKYLPENPELILTEFLKHLRRKISECKSTGDPRETELSSLDETLRGETSVTVRTACGLRSGRWIDEMVEDLPLIGQDLSPLPYVPGSDHEQMLHPGESEPLTLGGICKLDRGRTLALRRCVMILDAVVRRQDHSSATHHAWVGKAPIRYFLKSSNGAFPIVERFILPEDAHKGVTIDLDALVTELIEIWGESDRNLKKDSAHRFINEYFPVAAGIAGHDRMDRIFESAGNLYVKCQNNT